MVARDNFDFWQDHSEQFLVMAHLWDKRMAMEQPDGFGKKTGDCGDTITVYLSVKERMVERMTFELEGCINSSACANSVAMLVEGKAVEQCWNITPADIVEFLETLPEDHHHCADLAIGTLYLALADYAEKAKKPANVS